MLAEKRLAKVMTSCPRCKGLAEVVGVSGSVKKLRCACVGGGLVGKIRRDDPREVA